MDGFDVTRLLQIKFHFMVLSSVWEEDLAHSVVISKLFLHYYFKLPTIRLYWMPCLVTEGYPCINFCTQNATYTEAAKRKIQVILSFKGRKTSANLGTALKDVKIIF